MTTTTLLPQNASDTEIAIDQLAANKLAIDMSPVDTNPRTCPEEFLPWLAVAWRLDTTGLSINEQRNLIASALESHRYKGTVYAAQQALNSVFDDAQIEQFKDPAKPLYFDAKVTLAADTTRVYDAKKFATARRLVNAAKNLGTRFGVFDVAMPDAQLTINNSTAAWLSPTFDGQPTLDANANLTIKGYAQWML